MRDVPDTHWGGHHKGGSRASGWEGCHQQGCRSHHTQAGCEALKHCRKSTAKSRMLTTTWCACQADCEALELRTTSADKASMHTTTSAWQSNAYSLSDRLAGTMSRTIIRPHIRLHVRNKKGWSYYLAALSRSSRKSSLIGLSPSSAVPVA